MSSSRRSAPDSIDRTSRSRSRARRPRRCQPWCPDIRTGGTKRSTLQRASKAERVSSLPHERNDVADVLFERQTEIFRAFFQVVSFDGASKRFVLHSLHDRGWLEIEDASAGPHKRRRRHKAGHLVAAPQCLLETTLTRHATVVGVRKDGTRHPLRISALAENLAAAERMVLWRRPALVIEIVKQPDNAPLVLVLAEGPRVAAKGGFDTHRVLQQAVALRVLVQQSPGIVSIHERLQHLNSGAVSPHQRPIALMKAARGRLAYNPNGDGGDAVGGHLLERHPFGRVCIRRALKRATGGATKEINQHEMVFHVAAGVAGDAVQDLDHRADFDRQTCFLPHFANDSRLEGLPEFNAATGQAPVTFERLVSTLDQEHPIAVEHDRSNADNRAFGRRLHELSPRYRRARTRRPRLLTLTSIECSSLFDPDGQ